LQEIDDAKQTPSDDGARRGRFCAECQVNGNDMAVPTFGPIERKSTTVLRASLVLTAEASMKALARFSLVLCLVSALHDTAHSEEKKTEAGRPDDMVLIPGGKCVMGLTREQQQKLAAEYQVSPDLLGTQPYREVDLPSFWIDKYEVTNSQYRLFVKATGHRPPLACFWSVVRHRWPARCRRAFRCCRTATPGPVGYLP